MADEAQTAPYPILSESTHTGNGWTHDACGTELLKVTVSRPIHNGPFPLSGDGRVHNEDVPYCPTCQKAPNPNGAAIREDPSEAGELARLRRVGERLGR